MVSHEALVVIISVLPSITSEFRENPTKPVGSVPRKFHAPRPPTHNRVSCSPSPNLHLYSPLWTLLATALGSFCLGTKSVIDNVTNRMQHQHMCNMPGRLQVGSG